MRKSIIVITTLLTWTSLHFGWLHDTVLANANSEMDSNGSAGSHEVDSATEAASSAYGGVAGGDIAEGRPSLYWQIESPSAPVSACTFHFFSPLDFETLDNSWAAVQAVIANRCVAQLSPVRWNWGVNRSYILGNMPQSAACSLQAITHLRAGDWAANLQHKRAQTDWLSPLDLPGVASYELERCRRMQRLIENDGPNPWDAESLAVTLGPRANDGSHLLEGDGTDGGSYSGLSSGAQDSTHASVQPVSYTPEAADTLPATLSPGYSAMTPLPLEGLAMFYNPGIMQEVVEYRANMGEIEACSDCIGYAALLRAGDLNRKVWIRWGDGAVEGPFLVVDVAARHHVDMLLRRGWVVDVDNQTAVRRGLFMPVEVTVFSAPPALSRSLSQGE